MTETLTIAEEYAGPPFAANGGYVAGLLAEQLGVQGAHVELRAPVPMGRPLELTREHPIATLTAGGALLATIAPASLLQVEIPAVDFATAANAAAGVDQNDHPFPGCFVCGPRRDPSEGLHLLPGRVAPGRVAVTWRPAFWQTDQDGRVPLRLVTAALDCPSAFAVLGPGQTGLLASMTFRVERLPRLGDHLVVTGWRRKTEGRKMRASTAIMSTIGEVVARSDTLWIGVDAERLAVMESKMRRVAA